MAGKEIRIRILTIMILILTLTPLILTTGYSTCENSSRGKITIRKNIVREVKFELDGRLKEYTTEVTITIEGVGEIDLKDRTLFINASTLKFYEGPIPTAVEDYGIYVEIIWRKLKVNGKLIIKYRGESNIPPVKVKFTFKVNGKSIIPTKKYGLYILHANINDIVEYRINLVNNMPQMVCDDYKMKPPIIIMISLNIDEKYFDILSYKPKPNMTAYISGAKMLTWTLNLMNETEILLRLKVKKFNPWHEILMKPPMIKVLTSLDLLLRQLKISLRNLEESEKGLSLMYNSTYFMKQMLTNFTDFMNMFINRSMLIIWCAENASNAARQAASALSNASLKVNETLILLSRYEKKMEYYIEEYNRIRDKAYMGLQYMERTKTYLNEIKRFLEESVKAEEKIDQFIDILKELAETYNLTNYVNLDELENLVQEISPSGMLKEINELINVIEYYESLLQGVPKSIQIPNITELKLKLRDMGKFLEDGSKNLTMLADYLDMLSSNFKEMKYKMDSYLSTLKENATKLNEALENLNETLSNIREKKDFLNAYYIIVSTYERMRQMQKATIGVLGENKTRILGGEKVEIEYSGKTITVYKVSDDCLIVGFNGNSIDVIHIPYEDNSTLFEDMSLKVNMLRITPLLTLTEARKANKEVNSTRSWTSLFLKALIPFILSLIVITVFIVCYNRRRGFGREDMLREVDTLLRLIECEIRKRMAKKDSS